MALNPFKKKTEVLPSKQVLNSTVTQQLLKVEKLTLLLSQRVSAFYNDEIDMLYVESANLDSKILLQSKHDQYSAEVIGLRYAKEKLDKKVKPHQDESRAVLERILNLIINTNNSKRHLEIILGTILLNYPIDRRDSKFHRRTDISKVLKPVYQSAIIALMVEALIKDGYKFKTDYLAESFTGYHEMNKDEAQTVMSSIQKALIEIIYMKDMGLYSPNALAILERSDENNLLNMNDRKALLAESKRVAKEFHSYGIGVPTILAPMEVPQYHPTKALTKKEIAEIEEAKKNILEHEKALKQQAARFSFLRDVIDPKVGKHKEVDELLKVCQVYCSFMLSIKTIVDKELHIKAYEMMQQYAAEKKLNPYFTDVLLKMMGRFPIGSGIFFIDLRRSSIERGTVDKALVVGLNPLDPDEPIVKRVTTKYKYKLDVSVGTIAKDLNLYFERARDHRIFTPELKTRFTTQYLSDNDKDDPIYFSFRANEAFRTLAISEKSLW